MWVLSFSYTHVDNDKAISLGCLMLSGTLTCTAAYGFSLFSCFFCFLFPALLRASLWEAFLPPQQVSPDPLTPARKTRVSEQKPAAFCLSTPAALLAPTARTTSRETDAT